MSTDLLDELARLGHAIDRTTTPIDVGEFADPSPAAGEPREASEATGCYIADRATMSAARTRRVVATVAAAVITTAGLAFIAASPRRPGPPLHPPTPHAPETSRTIDTAISATPSAPATAEASVSAPTPTPASAVTTQPTPFDGAPRALEVRVVDPAGTVARSGVGSLAAGPRGFVATGTGFERGSNPGRLWFSPDGRGWTEPDVGTFAGLDVGPVVATPSWYLVQASTRGATEFESGSPRSYRSADGTTWEPVPASGSAGTTVAVGSQFVRTSTTGAEESDDALTWKPVDNPALNGVTITSASAFGGRIYVVGFPSSGAGVPQAFTGTSLTDLHPTVAPTGGGIGSIAALPGGAVAVANDLGTCLPSTDVQRGPGLTVEARCGRRQIVRFLPMDAGAWSVLTDQGPVTDDLWHPVQSFGDQLVQFVTGPDRHLSVAVSADGVTWSRISDVDVDLLEGLDPRDSGSPDTALVAVRADIVVAIVTLPNAPGVAGMHSRLVVGTLAG